MISNFEILSPLSDLELKIILALKKERGDFISNLSLKGYGSRSLLQRGLKSLIDKKYIQRRVSPFRKRGDLNYFYKLSPLLEKRLDCEDPIPDHTLLKRKVEMSYRMLLPQYNFKDELELSKGFINQYECDFEFFNDSLHFAVEIERTKKWKDSYYEDKFFHYEVSKYEKVFYVLNYDLDLNKFLNLSKPFKKIYFSSILNFHKFYKESDSFNFIDLVCSGEHK